MPRRLTRRRFLKLGSMAGAGMLLPGQFSLGCGDNGQVGESGTTASPDYRLPGELDRFIDPLPRPPVISPDTTKYAGSDYYEIALSQFSQQIHSQLQPTEVWGYDGTYPGPTIEARRGRPVRVKWINDRMPSTHLLRDAIDTTIFRGKRYPDVRTITHLHGGHTPPRSDGHPDAWSTPGAGETGPHFTPGDFIYPNDQQACTLWYHDHAMGITRLNVYAGLAGMYLIRDEVEDGLELPRGDFEVPLIIQDRMFNDDGSLYYPAKGISPAHPVWNMLFFGDTPVVNGRAFPFLEVERRRYRFRVLNGSQARFYNLWFEGAAGPMAFHVIGSDGGLLSHPVETSSLLLAPGERADVVADFSQLEAGEAVTLKNDAAAPFPMGGSLVIGEIMQFRVRAAAGGSGPSSPDTAVDDVSTPAGRLELPPIAPLTATPGIAARDIVLIEHGAPDAELGQITMDPRGAGGPRLGFTEFLINGKSFDAPADEKPAAGTTEIWQFFNATGDTHPIHVHLVQFQIVNRQKVDSTALYNQWEAWTNGNGPRPAYADHVTGPPVPPSPEEAGWKDTAHAGPLEILRLIARFDLPAGVELPARYVYHCHILEHEDNEMMRPFEVV